MTITSYWNTYTYAFCGETHKELTNKAISSDSKSVLEAYLKEQLGMDQGLDTLLFIDQSTIPESDRIPSKQLEDRIESEITENPTVLNLLKAGANLEDVPNPRAKHHFHDPVRNIGLDNKTEHPEKAEFIDSITLLYYKLSFDLTGTSAIKRALGTEESDWEQEYKNYFAWPDARNYFYKALTDANEAVREHYLAMTFLSLGHVFHLLEDMGVPAHVRNDFIEAHYRVPKGMWGNPFESHVEDEIEDIAAIPARWLGGWTPQPKIFSKISHYWDMNDYTGQFVGASPLSTWGLSEQTNYQFLSKSTIFRENDGTKYYFPHPDPCYLGVHIDSSWWYKRRYKTGYGITHLARTKFIEKYVIAENEPNHIYGPSSQWSYRTEKVPYDTTFDNAVYEDYAKVTIPRTIDFVTGLTNYFFRGKLEIEPNCLDCNTVTFAIRNTSINTNIPQILKCGTFELFYDDSNGTRTKVSDFTIPGWTHDSILEYEQQITGTFSRPDCNEIRQYTVVYKGAISENPDQPDEDDPDAIAAATLTFGYPIIAWGYDNHGQVSDIPDGNDFVDVAAGKYHGLAIRSNGSLAAWGYNDYGQCDVPEGNDFIAIAGGSRHSIALKSDGSIVGWGDNSFSQIDVPEGNDYVAIASGDYHNLAINTDGLIIGWGRDYYGETIAPPPDVGTVYISVSAGRYHSLALQSDGTIKAWGGNNNGQTTIYAGAGNDHEAIAAADDYNFLLRTDDMLITWGGGDFYSPGIPDYHYRQPDGTDFIAIAAGGYHILALTADGEILSWGYDDFNPPVYPVPQDIVFTNDIAPGWKFSLALEKR